LSSKEALPKGLPYSSCKHAYVRHLERKKIGLWIIYVRIPFSGDRPASPVWGRRPFSAQSKTSLTSADSGRGRQAVLVIDI
jgi:hypothetical protein